MSEMTMQGSEHSNKLIEVFKQWHYGPTESVLHTILEEMEIIPQDKNLDLVLDAGGAYGRDAIAFTSVSKKVVVIDINKEYIKLGRQLLEKQEFQQEQLSKIEFKEGDLRDESYTNKLLEKFSTKFNLIYSYQLLHLFDKLELQQVFNNFNRLLVDNGKMVHMFLSDICPLTRDAENKYAEHHDPIGNKVMYHAHSEVRIRDLLTLTGFELTKDKSSNDQLGYVYVAELHAVYKERISQLHTHIMWFLSCKKK